MNEKIILIVISSIAGFLSSVAIYLFKRNDKEQTQLRECAQKNSFEIDHIKSKLWEEDKLEKTIKNAVKSALNEWELIKIKEGYFHKHE